MLEHCFGDAIIRTLAILNSAGNLHVVDVPSEIVVTRIGTVAKLNSTVDLAIVFDELAGKSETDASQLLGLLRNRHCRRLLVFGRGEESPLTANTMRALGFASFDYPCDRDGYVYDIDTYNEKREWNNSENWAHPESFDKRRF